MKYAAGRPFDDPEKAARKLVEIANAVEPYMDQRVLIELINGPFLKAGGSPAEYRAGLDLAIAEGWLWRHESGTYVKFTPAGAETVRKWVLAVAAIVKEPLERVLPKGGGRDFGAFWMLLQPDQPHLVLLMAILRDYPARCSPDGVGHQYGTGAVPVNGLA